MTKIFTKEQIIESLRDIRELGFVKSCRPQEKNDGAVGNTLETLLGIEENNLAIFNAGEWEIKAKRKHSNSLTTLVHKEPSPRNYKFVPDILLPQFGWRHDNAGLKYPDDEKSFRQTINAQKPTDRGFRILVNRDERKIEIAFDSKLVSARHNAWLSQVDTIRGLQELEIKPYWGFDDIVHMIASKLHNMFFIEADVKKIENVEYFSYSSILMLSSITVEAFVDAVEAGKIYIDFDARTRHNHGTKFRIKKKDIINLYSQNIVI